MDMKIIIGIVVFVIICIYSWIKVNRDTEAGKNSEEKQAIDKLISTLAPEGEDMTAAYATWEITKWQGKTKYTDYWYYAIGFGDNTLIVVPLSFDGGDMSYGEPVAFAKENIKIVNSDKNNLIPWVELYENEEDCMLSIMVRADNTKDDRFHPVNIQQQEATQKFIEWRDKWMYDVNEVNGIEVTGKQQKPLKKKK